MLSALTQARIPEFLQACAYEHVFGANICTSLRTYGTADPGVQFYLFEEDGQPTAAACANHGILTVAAAPHTDPAPLAALARQLHVQEVHTNEALGRALQRRLGGTFDGSYFMVYNGDALPPAAHTLVPGQLACVFSVLWHSHPFYRAHYTYEAWAADQACKRDKGLVELYQLELNGQVVGTGSITAQDDTCGIVGGVAVLPEYRGQGLGTSISRFVTRRILELGKTPRLMSGYDAVAALYRQVRFVPCGRWGQVCL